MPYCTRITCGCPLFISLCLSFVSWFSLLSPFLAMMSFAGYFHVRFLPSAFFSVCLFRFVFSDRVRFRCVLVQLPLSYDYHSWIRSASVNNVR